MLQTKPILNKFCFKPTRVKQAELPLHSVGMLCFEEEPKDLWMQEPRAQAGVVGMGRSKPAALISKQMLAALQLGKQCGCVGSL